MSEAQINQSNSMIQMTNDIQNQADAWNETLESANQYLNRISEGETDFDITGMTGDESEFTDIVNVTLSFVQFVVFGVIFTVSNVLSILFTAKLFLLIFPAASFT